MICFRAYSLVWILASLTAQTAVALPKSSLESSVPGISLPNVHLLARGKGSVYRGSQPNAQSVSELMKLGVREVVIFKNDTRGEVAQEIAAFRQAGLPAQNVRHLPMGWNKLPPYSEICRMTLTALSYLDRAYRTPGASIYFHCSMGEDRTGMLAGLFRIAEQGWTVDQAFQQEMCEYGYEAGDPKKPGHVVRGIRQELTPLFLKLAYLLEKSRATRKPLDASVCGAQAEAEAIAALKKLDLRRFVCSPETTSARR